jgi:antitoxin HicB
MTDFSKLPLMGADRFASILKEKNIEEEVSIGSWKRIIASRLRYEMAEQKISKSAMCARIGTSRPQLERILNENAENVTLETLVRAAHAVGKSVRLDLI